MAALAKEGVHVMKRIVLLVTLFACTQREPAPASTAPLPQPEGRAQPTASARTLPKLDTSCNADADCAVISDETQDDAPRTYACCPSCTQRAANASWYQRFQAACATSPAPMCPPIGCAQPVARAVCSDHKCQLAKK